MNEKIISKRVLQAKQKIFQVVIGDDDRYLAADNYLT
jgi:hypothetical protein